MKLRYLSIIAVAATIIFSLSHQETAQSNAAAPPTGHTGAPSEVTCNTSGCHTGSSVVTTSSTIVFASVPTGALTNGYTPGTVYNLTINFNANTSKKGFELTALDASNNAAGTLALSGATSSTVSLQSGSGRQYISHKNAGSTSAWSFKWTAPAAGTGSVTFYVAANAANGDNTDGGDIIHTNTFVVTEAGGGSCTGFSASISGNTSICAGNNATLTAASVGGTSSDAYHWSNNTTASTLTVNTAGNYQVTVTNGSCTATSSVAVTQAAAGVADFNLTVDSTGAHINNTSTNIASYHWDFGDSLPSGTSSSQFTHAYSAAGQYHIVLTATDNCGATTTHDTTITVTIAVHTGIDNLAQHSVSIYPNPITDNFSINVDGNVEHFTLNIYNMAGRIVRSVEGNTGGSVALNRDGLSKGIYIYRVVMANNTLSGKLVVE